MFDDEVIHEQPIKKRSIKKGVYILPNLITSASLFGGFYSIICSLDGRFEDAAFAVLLSAILDGLDGRVARLTGSSSNFGVEYDSLADLVAFGLAPGILIFTWALRPFGRYGWLAAFLYVVCGALRLARFNVQVTTIESKRFNGLPIPAAAVMVSTTVLLFFDQGLGHEMVKHVTVLALVYILAFFMISNVKFYSFKEFNLTKRMPFKILVFLIVLLIVVANYPTLMLFGLTLAYVISGPITTLVDRRNSKNKIHVVPYEPIHKKK